MIVNSMYGCGSTREPNYPCLLVYFCDLVDHYCRIPINLVLSAYTLGATVGSIRSVLSVG
jgi:hypothetical protein